MNGQRSRKEDFERKSRQVVFSLVFSLKKKKQGFSPRKGKKLIETLAVFCACGG